MYISLCTDICVRVFEKIDEMKEYIYIYIYIFFFKQICYRVGSRDEHSSIINYKCPSAKCSGFCFVTTLDVVILIRNPLKLMSFRYQSLGNITVLLINS